MAAKVGRDVAEAESARASVLMICLTRPARSAAGTVAVWDLVPATISLLGHRLHGTPTTPLSTLRPCQADPRPQARLRAAVQRDSLIVICRGVGSLWLRAAARPAVACCATAVEDPDATRCGGCGRPPGSRVRRVLIWRVHGP